MGALSNQSNIILINLKAYMKSRQFLGLLFSVLLMVCGLVSCHQMTQFNQIPRNGFITHFEESDGSRMPFASYWDISDNSDWNERVQGSRNKSQPVYVKPISLSYFSPGPSLKAQSPEVIRLRDYFQDTLTAELKRQDVSANTFHLLDAPAPNAYTVEIARFPLHPHASSTMQLQ